MKCPHMHPAVDDLQQNVRFYSTLSGAVPTVRWPRNRARN